MAVNPHNHENPNLAGQYPPPPPAPASPDEDLRQEARRVERLAPPTPGEMYSFDAIPAIQTTTIRAVIVGVVALLAAVGVKLAVDDEQVTKITEGISAVVMLVSYWYAARGRITATKVVDSPSNPKARAYRRTGGFLSFVLFGLVASFALGGCAVLKPPTNAAERAQYVENLNFYANLAGALREQIALEPPGESRDAMVKRLARAEWFVAFYRKLVEGPTTTRSSSLTTARSVESSGEVSYGVQIATPSGQRGVTLTAIGLGAPNAIRFCSRNASVCDPGSNSSRLSRPVANCQTRKTSSVAMMARNRLAERDRLTMGTPNRTAHERCAFNRSAIGIALRRSVTGTGDA
jgi:hypothetical protein